MACKDIYSVKKKKLFSWVYDKFPNRTHLPADKAGITQIFNDFH